MKAVKLGLCFCVTETTFSTFGFKSNIFMTRKLNKTKPNPYPPTKNPNQKNRQQKSKKTLICGVAFLFVSVIHDLMVLPVTFS